MTDIKMTDHQNCRTWNCRSRKWRTKFAGYKIAKPDNTEHLALIIHAVGLKW